MHSRYDAARALPTANMVDCSGRRSRNPSLPRAIAACAASSSPTDVGHLQSRLSRIGGQGVLPDSLCPALLGAAPRLRGMSRRRSPTTESTFAASTARAVWDSSGSCQTPCSTPSIQMRTPPPLGRSRGHRRMDEDHRVICWSINSLAVPYEKKTSIVSNGKFVVLLRARVSGLRHVSNLRRHISAASPF